MWSESLDRRKRIEASFSTGEVTDGSASKDGAHRVNLKIAAFNLLYSGVLFR